MDSIIYAAPAAGALALLYAWIKASWVSKQDAGDARMQEIAAEISKGAMAFLARVHNSFPSWLHLRRDYAISCSCWVCI